jgi:hypothetical protein
MTPFRAEIAHIRHGFYDVNNLLSLAFTHKNLFGVIAYETKITFVDKHRCDDELLMISLTIRFNDKTHLSSRRVKNRAV